MTIRSENDEIPPSTTQERCFTLNAPNYQFVNDNSVPNNTNSSHTSVPGGENRFFVSNHTLPKSEGLSSGNYPPNQTIHPNWNYEPTASKKYESADTYFFHLQQILENTNNP